MDDEKTLIVCEIGQNHCGNLDLALDLIVKAHESGADLVKFQLYDHNKLYADHPEIPDAGLSFEQARFLFNAGEHEGIEVFFSVFDEERVKWCEEIGVKRYKIAARVDDDKLLAAIAETKKPVIASVSPHYPRDKKWSQAFYNLDLLYCASKYPSPLQSLRFNHVDYTLEYQGFSDHTIGLDAAKIALARGARIIEKHFAEDHKTGIDAEWSMDEKELRELVRFKNVVSKVL